MKRVNRLTILILTIVLSIFFTTGTLFGEDAKVTLLEKLELSENEGRLEKAKAFCVSNDELFLIPDYEAGDIKIYLQGKEKSLELIKTIGRKGYGPGEFILPIHCTINDKEGKFAVMDYGLRKIFIYDRDGGKSFKRIREINCQRLGYDIELIGEKLFVSGFSADENENHFDLYYVNLKENKNDLLLPSFKKYGLKSNEQYMIEYFEKPDIQVIGVHGFFSVQGDEIYFSWEGDEKFWKSSINAPKWDDFGQEPVVYVRPSASKILKYQRGQPLHSGDRDIVEGEKSKMSYVRNIFTNSHNVLLIFEGPGKSNFTLQYYSLNGEFINEVTIKEDKFDRRMWFDNKKNILYSLTGGGKSSHSILKYKIPIVSK